jgi:tRNA dimethylallyltransferase
MAKTCIIICGPTASGKTAAAIALAQKYNTSIISADSRQCFKELNIAVAKPTTAQLNAVPHFFINSHSIFDNVNAAVYEKYALKKLSEIFEQNDVAIVCGGTGLYLKALCDGQDNIPSIPKEIREKINQQYNENGLGWLQTQLKLHDEKFASKGEMQNPQRMQRALEVVLHTNKSILDFYTDSKTKRDFNVIKLAVEIDRQFLYNNINKRVDEMLEAGLVTEAKELLPHKELNALQTVGYTELFEHFEGKIGLPTAIEKIKQHTRNYAKRQVTWFKRDESVQWLSVNDIANFSF